MKKEERKSTKNKEIMIMITSQKKGVIKVNDGRKEIDEVRNERTEPAITITIALNKKRIKITVAPRRKRQRVAEKIGKQTRTRERGRKREVTHRVRERETSQKDGRNAERKR